MAISRLLLGSPGTKSHSDVGATGRHKKYYMREGGGFPRVWVVVSLMSPDSPVACPSVTEQGVTEQVVFDNFCSVNAKFILRV